MFLQKKYNIFLVFGVILLAFFAFEAYISQLHQNLQTRRINAHLRHQEDATLLAFEHLTNRTTQLTLMIHKFFFDSSSLSEKELRWNLLQNDWPEIVAIFLESSQQSLWLERQPNGYPLKSLNTLQKMTQQLQNPQMIWKQFGLYHYTINNNQKICIVLDLYELWYLFFSHLDMHQANQISILTEKDSVVYTVPLGSQDALQETSSMVLQSTAPISLQTNRWLAHSFHILDTPWRTVIELTAPPQASLLPETRSQQLLIILFGFAFLGVIVLLFVLFWRYILVHDVEQKKAVLAAKEDKLWVHEALFQFLFQFSGEAIIVFVDGKFWNCNQKALALFQATEEEIAFLSPRLFEFCTLTNHAPVNKIEKPLHRPDQTTFVAEILCNKIPMEGKNLHQLFIRDITQQKIMEVEILNRNRKLDLLNQLIQVFNSTSQLEEVLSYFLEELRKELASSGASVWIFDEDEKKLICRQAAGISSEQILGWKLESFQGIAGHAYNSQKPILVNDTVKDSRYFPGVDQFTHQPMRSILALPLKVRQKVIGVMEIVDERPMAFAPSDVETLIELAEVAAIPIENAMLFEYGRRELENRKKIEIALRRRDAILRAISISAEHFLKASHWRQNIHSVLKNLGQATNVSRVYIFQNETNVQGKLCMSQKFEWTASSVVPEIDNPDLKLLPYEAAEVGEQVYDLLSQGKYYLKIVEELEGPEKEILEEQGIASILLVPIFTQKRWWGFIGFDDCQKERAWSISEINILWTAADMIGAVVEREKMEKELQLHKRNLEDLVLARTEQYNKTNQKLQLEIYERMRTEDALRIAKEEAEKANRAKSDFLANISHEIRTPMNSIIGMTDLALKTQLDSKQKDFLESVKISAENLMVLINDLLDFSKMDAQKMDIHPEVFFLDSFLQNFEKPFRLQAERKGLDFTLHTEKGLPNILKGDSFRIQQILTNLVGNALKFTETGSIHLAVEKSSNHSTNDEKIILQFSVQDTGIGISDQKLPFIFESFSQGDGSYSRRFGGTGLGLAISKRLAELMDGEIWVESTPEQGSCFYFTVTLEQGDIHQHVSPVQEIPKIELPPLKILVVEDFLPNQKLIREILHDLGFESKIAGNGLEALACLENETFDLILMDVQMPEMDGITATQKIRASTDKAFHRIPIIALTAHALQSEQQHFLRIGMDDFLSKPIDVFRLKKALIDIYQTKICNDSIEINWDQAAEFLGGNMELLKGFVESVIENVPEQTELLRQALLQQNWPEIVRLTHSIKAVARQLHVVDLHYLGERLEEASQKENILYVRHMMECYFQRIQNFLQLTQAFLHSRS